VVEAGTTLAEFEAAFALAATTFALEDWAAKACMAPKRNDSAKTSSTMTAKQ